MQALGRNPFIIEILAHKLNVWSMKLNFVINSERNCTMTHILVFYIFKMIIYYVYMDNANKCRQY